MTDQTVMFQELSMAKNQDLLASLTAIRRAAQMARQIAMQTDTAIVVVKDGKTVRIPAAQLREEKAAPRAGSFE
jgi:hypothetical protein